MAPTAKNIASRLLGVAILATFALWLVSAGPANAATNGPIAFVSNRDGDNEIYSMNPDGTDVVQLTQNTSDDITPPGHLTEPASRSRLPAVARTRSTS